MAPRSMKKLAAVSSQAGSSRKGSSRKDGALKKPAASSSSKAGSSRTDILKKPAAASNVKLVTRDTSYVGTRGAVWLLTETNRGPVTSAKFVEKWVRITEPRFDSSGQGGSAAADGPRGTDVHIE